MVDKSVLISEYVKALRQNNASIFIGSGMSKSVSGLDWKNLIMPYAEIIGYSQKDNNYPFIAQAYVNAGHDVNGFKKDICDKFKSHETPAFHTLIARLPIKNYWTTNYDTLIENALDAEKKHKDVIFDNASFCSLDDTRDHIVYKCHGDCNHSESIVITQQDYECYRLKAFNFSNALYNELASSTILFLGYSFSDPDINNILATLSTINDVKQTHYMITKREKGNKAIKQEHWIKNLERYGIKTVLIGDYRYTMNIMSEIEKRYMANKIMISGSANIYPANLPEKEARQFIYELGYRLIEFDCSKSNIGHGLKIINGNGLGVGPYLYEGISEATATFELDMADYLMMYPFPKKYYLEYEKDKSLEEKYQKYREKMIDKCGVVFFMFGNRYDDQGNLVNAPGVRKEFDIAFKKNKYVFPIGATGYTAKELADQVLADFERYNGKMPNIKRILKELNSPKIESKDIIENILKIIETLAFRPENK